MKTLKLLILTISVLFIFHAKSTDMYICTCADERFFPHLLNFIGCLHKVNFNEIKEIAVFNLGFTQKQIDVLKKIKKVAVYDTEMTNPDMFTHFFTRPGNKKPVRGWYSWKPVALKKSLDMYPYVLHADAACIFLKPLQKLFQHIEQNGYFFLTCGHDINRMTNKYVRDKFNLESENRKWMLDEKTYGLRGGFIGISRKYYDSYVLPLYEFSHDIKYFADDGSTPAGFGTGRAQAVFSVLARLLDLDINTIHSIIHLKIDGKKTQFCLEHILWQQKPERWVKMRKHIRYN